MANLHLYWRHVEWLRSPRRHPFGVIIGSKRWRVARGLLIGVASCRPRKSGSDLVDWSYEDPLGYSPTGFTDTNSILRSRS